MDSELRGNGQEFSTPKDFNDLNLSEIELRESPEYTVVPIIIEGRIFNLKFSLTTTIDEHNEEEIREISIALINKEKNPAEVTSSAQPLMWAGFSFRLNTWDNSPVVAKTGIKKNKIENILPPGLGIVLYRKMIDFVESQKNIYGERGIRHEVNHMPMYGLNKEKWIETFGPLLQEKGYVRTSRERENEKWEKLY